LIEKRLPLDLVYRIFETDIVATYSLPGTISYLKHGGDLSRITPQDGSELERVMGPDAYQFKFPLTGLRTLLPGYVLSIAQGFGDPARVSDLLAKAVN
jgi:hypothetical protein